MQILKKGILCGFALIMLASSTDAFCMKNYKKDSLDLVEAYYNGDSLEEFETVVVNTDKPFRSEKLSEEDTFKEWYEADEKVGRMPSMGLGDQIQALPSVKHLKNLGVKKIIYNVSGILKPLMKNCAGYEVDLCKAKYAKQIQLSTLYNVNDSMVPEYNCKTPLLVPNSEKVKKWQELLNMYSGGKMPVVVFWGCAKNHRPDRALKSEELFKLVKNSKNVQYFDAEFRSPYDYEGLPNVDEVIKPSSIWTNFDKPAFCDSLALLVACFKNGGKAVSTETGTVHVAGRAAEGAFSDVVYGLGPVDPNERYYPDCYPEKKSTTRMYPKSVKVCWQEKKNDWMPTVKKLKNELEALGQKFKVTKN